MKLAWCSRRQPGGLLKSGSPALAKFVPLTVPEPPKLLAATSPNVVHAALMAGSVHLTLPWYHC